MSKRKRHNIANSPADSAAVTERDASGHSTVLRPSRRIWGLPWLLFLVLTLLYLPSLRHQFVYDDEVLIIQESRPEGWVDFANIFRERHFPTVPYYRPLLRLSFRFQKYVHGDTAWPYHLVNALLAGVAVLVTFRLLSRPVFRIRRSVAAVAALGWALHPALSSCVYPICSGRETLLPSIFMLLCLDAWIRPGRKWGMTALGWFTLALFSKEQAIVLPVILVLCDLLDFSGEARIRRPRVFAWRYGVPAAVIGGYLALRWGLFGGSEFELNLEQPLMPLYSYLYALQTAFFPFVDLVYEPPVPVWWSFGRVLSALALTAALVVACLRRGLGRLVLFWGAWFFVIQAPTANFLKQEAPFDERYMALAALALVALAASLYSRYAESGGLPRRAIRAGVILLLLFWAAVSLNRGRFFQDDTAFIFQWIRTNPYSVDALVNYSKYRIDREEYDRALWAADRAVRLAPDLAGANYNYGLASYHLGDPEVAIAAYRRALELEPGHKAHYNLALALADTGQIEPAMAHYRLALKRDPEHVDALYNLGLLLAGQGDLDGSLTYFEQATALAPGDAEAVYNRGVALEKLQRWEEAEAAYRQALTRNPDHTGSLFNLGTGMFRRQRFDEAAHFYARILAIDPADEQARQYLRLATAAAREQSAENQPATRRDREETMRNK